MNKTNYPDSKEFWADKKVCVTGGDGFLGSFVQKVLAERGAKNVFIPLIDDYDLTDKDNIQRMRIIVPFFIFGIIEYYRK